MFVIMILNIRSPLNILQKGVLLVVEREDNKSYIEILEQFLDTCKGKDMAELYEKAAAGVVDYLEKSN